MIRRLLTALVLIVTALVLIAFAIANRHPIDLALDPFDQTSPALAFSLPVYLLVFAVLIAGVLLGGCAAWLGQAKWRARARRAEAQVRDLRAQLGPRSGEPAARLPDEPLRLVVPPPAA